MFRSPPLPAGKERNMHAYHPACGCAACDATDDADERRDEAIALVAPDIAARLIGSDDFAWGVLFDLPLVAKHSFLQDLGRFFTDYHALDANDTRGAMELARRLYLDLLPQMQAAAAEQAQDEAAYAYDMGVAA